jgi:hypothetical protein
MVQMQRLASYQSVPACQNSWAASSRRPPAEESDVYNEGRLLRSLEALLWRMLGTAACCRPGKPQPLQRAPRAARRSQANRLDSRSAHTGAASERDQGHRTARGRRCTAGVKPLTSAARKEHRCVKRVLENEGHCADPGGGVSNPDSSSSHRASVRVQSFSVRLFYASVTPRGYMLLPGQIICARIHSKNIKTKVYGH